MSGRSQGVETAGRLLWKQLFGRAMEQKSLMEATEQVAKRTSKVPTEAEAPLPNDLLASVAAPADPGMPPTAAPPEAPSTPPRPDPYTKQETSSVLAERGKETPDKGTITDTNLINQARTTYPENYGEFANAILRVEGERGNIQPKKTFEGIKAESRSVDWQTIRQKQESKTPLTTEELTYLRDVDAAMHRQFADETELMMQKWERGDVTDAEEFAFRQNLAAVGQISAYLHGEKRRIAQSLASMRMVADNPGIAKFQRKDFLDLMNAEDNFGDLLTSIKMARTTKEFKDILENDNWGKKLLRIGGNVWYNSVLSKFAIGKAMLGGAVINKGVYPIEALFGSWVSKARKAFGDDLAAQPAFNRQVRAGEAALEFMGAFQGMRDAVAPIWKHLVDPDYDIGPVHFDRKMQPKDTLFANFGGKGVKSDILLQLADGWSQNGSRRLMMMTDFTVRSVAFQQKVKALAYRIAANEGLEGDELVKRVTQIFKEMPDDVFNEAVDAGKRATMTQELKGSMESIQKGIGKVPGARFFMPFTRTMLAMLDMALERTPGVAHMTTRVQQEWAKGGAARDMVVARQMLGLTLMGLGYTMGMSGESTSGAYLSKNDQYEKMKSGWRPNSIVTADGTYVSINMASPVYEMFQFGTSVYEISHYMNAGLSPDDPRYKTWEDVIMEIAGGAAWTFADITLNKSVGQSMRELLEAINDPKSAGKYKSLNVVTPFFTPGFGTGLIRRTGDPERRRVASGTFMEELWGNIQNNLPGLSDNLPPAIGYFGESKPHYSLLDGFSWSPTDENADLFLELYRNGMATRMPPKTTRFGLSDINLDQDISPEDFSESARRNPVEAKEIIAGDGARIRIPAAGKGEIEKRGYAYYRYSQIRGAMYRDMLKALFKTDAYKNPDQNAVRQAAEVGLSPRAMAIEKTLRAADQAAKKMLLGELNTQLKSTSSKLRETIRMRDTEQSQFIPPGLTKQQEKQQRAYDAENERLRGLHFDTGGNQ